MLTLLAQQEIQNALSILAEGGIILYPSDSIWGIGCDATNSKSVDQISKIKKRPTEKSLIVLVADEEALFQLVPSFPSVFLHTLKQQTPAPSVIYPHAHRKISDHLFSANGSICVRLVMPGFAQQLIQQFGKALTSTSANFSGENTPLRFEDISPELIAQMDYVVKPQYVDETTMSKTPSPLIKLGEEGQIESWIRR